MSTITKERLEPVIERFEHYATNVKWTNVQAAQDMLIVVDAMRRLLASLEAEKTILYRERNPYNGLTTGWQELTDDEYEFIKDNAGENAEFRTVFTAPPAPVVPEEMPKGLAGQIVSLLAHNIGDKFLAQKIWNACRDAMLQGADQPQNAPQNIPEKIPARWRQWIIDVVEYLENGLEVDGELEAQGSVDAKRLLAAAPLQEVKQCT